MIRHIELFKGKYAVFAGKVWRAQSEKESKVCLLGRSLPCNSLQRAASIWHNFIEAGVGYELRDSPIIYKALLGFKNEDIGTIDDYF